MFHFFVYDVFLKIAANVLRIGDGRAFQYKSSIEELHFG
jgi:hypothetical protein